MFLEDLLLDIKILKKKQTGRTLVKLNCIWKKEILFYRQTCH